jgi:lactoylglutathione lyase
MMIAHVALWVTDLEAMRAFYEANFGAKANGRYENRAKGFSSYFLTFPGGARLELMRKDSIVANSCLEEIGPSRLTDEKPGFAHLAFSCGVEADVDRLTKELSERGIEVVSAPRRTGDGYYESVIRDPEGNLLEITADVAKATAASPLCD